LQLVMLDYKKDNTYMHLLLHNQPWATNLLFKLLKDLVCVQVPVPARVRQHVMLHAAPLHWVFLRLTVTLKRVPRHEESSTFNMLYTLSREREWFQDRVQSIVGHTARQYVRGLGAVLNTIIKWFENQILQIYLMSPHARSSGMMVDFGFQLHEFQIPGAWFQNLTWWIPYSIPADFRILRRLNPGSLDSWLLRQNFMDPGLPHMGRLKDIDDKFVSLFIRFVCFLKFEIVVMVVKWRHHANLLLDVYIGDREFWSIVDELNFSL
jgi:hypothetical protein